jgi:hypothetical protein
MLIVVAYGLALSAIPPSLWLLLWQRPRRRAARCATRLRGQGMAGGVVGATRRQRNRRRRSDRPRRLEPTERRRHARDIHASLSRRTRTPRTLATPGRDHVLAWSCRPLYVKAGITPSPSTSAQRRASTTSRLGGDAAALAGRDRARGDEILGHSTIARAVIDAFAAPSVLRHILNTP